MKKIRKARGVSILLMFMMVFQLIMPVNLVYGDTIPDEKTDNLNVFSDTTTGTAIIFDLPVPLDSGGKNLGNIFTFESMTIDDEPVGDGDVIEVTDGTKVKLSFKWDTEGKDAKPNDTASIQLPDIFELVNVSNQNIELADGTVVGTYSIENGLLIFVFNDEIDNEDYVQNGYVNLNLKFNLNRFEENIEQEIPFNDSENTTLKVVAKPTEELSGIDKEGHPNGTGDDGKHDATEITWTIDVINTNDEPITAATVTDVIPDGLSLKTGSIVIRELIISLDGSVSAGSPVSPGVSSGITIQEDPFKVDFEEMGPYKGYRIEYTTTIDDLEKMPFTNEAYFKYDDETLEADATVEGLTRSNPIEKDGWINKTVDTDTISWVIDVNKNGMEIDDAWVADNLPPGLAIVLDTIEVVRITKGNDSWAEGAPHTGTFTGFPMNLGKLTADDAYRIKFDTKVDWSAANSGVYQEENSFTNVATLYDGTVSDENKLNDDDATVEFDRPPILEKVGIDNVDYNNKTIKWKVTVNKAKHPFNNTLTVTDYLPVGLELVTDGSGNAIVNISTDAEVDYDNYVVNGPVDVNGGEHDGKTKLEVILNNVGEQTLEITYTTKIIDFKISNFVFSNEVGMVGVGVGDGGEPRNAEVTPKNNSYGKSYKGINYSEKTIDWEIKVQPKREPINKLTIEDTFPNKGMILLPDTVKVKYGGTDLTTGSAITYTLNPRTEGVEVGYHKGFIIEFSGSPLNINDELVITYKTSYDPEVKVDGKTLEPHEPNLGDGSPSDNKDRLYYNRAHFTGTTTNGNPINIEIDAHHRVRTDSYNSGKKEGQFVYVDDDKNIVNNNKWVSGYERKIAWQVYINYLKLNLGENVVVTDTLGYPGVIDEDSIKISVYNVNQYGITSITKTVLDPADYSVATSGSAFTVTFLKEVKERYVIEFTTSVPEISLGSYTNTATVTTEDGVPREYKATLNYSAANKFLQKGADVEGNEVFTGDEVDWEVKVNESLSIIHNAVITDTISAGHVYVADSLEVYKSDTPLVEGTDYNLDVSTTDEEETVLEIKLNSTLSETLVLRYKTVVTETDGEIGNTVELSGTSFETKKVSSDKLEAEQFSEAGGEWAPSRGVLRLKKVDADTGNTIASSEATFRVWFDLNDERVEYTQVDNVGNIVPFRTVNGELVIANLPLRTYYIKEVEAPEGYVLSDKVITIVVDKAYRDNTANIAEENFENYRKSDVTATKVWEGGTRPTIWFKLFRQIGNGDAEAVPDAEIKKLSNGTTSVTWDNLPTADASGNRYIYSVKEVDENGDDFTPVNYVKTENGLTVTNQYNSPKDAFAKAVKVWENGSTDRPTVWFKLYRNIAGGETEEVPEVELKELSSGTTEVAWTGLTKTDGDGNEYIYTVKEVDSEGNEFAPENYVKIENGLTVTNTYISPTTTVSAIKVWRGGSDPRPTIWFELYR